MRIPGLDDVACHARMFSWALRSPQASLTLELLRSDLSHETSAKIARIVAILAEWRKGYYLATDPADLDDLLAFLECTLLTYSKLAAQSLRTWVALSRILAGLRSCRRLLAHGRASHGSPLSRLSRLEGRVNEVKTQCGSLVETLSARYAARLEDIVASAAADVRRELGRFASGAIDLELDVERDRLTWIPRDDAASWADVLRNLIRNAAEATAQRLAELPERGDREARAAPVHSAAVTLRVRFLQSPARTQIEVMDQGLGMAPDWVERIWTAGISSRGAGRGHGLTETKKAFVASRADLEVRSAIGVGTVFRIEVPDRPVQIPEASVRVSFRALVPVLVIATGFGVAALLSVDRDPVSVERVGGSAIKAIGANGQVLWARDLRETIVTNCTAPDWMSEEHARLMNEFLVLRSLGGRTKGIVVTTLTPQGKGRMWILDRGGRPARSHLLRWHPPVEEPLGQLESPWQVAVPWNDAMEQAVGVHVRDGHFTPSCTQFFSVDGDSLGAYYHWGHLQFRSASDIDGDGRNEILLFGINNYAPMDTSVYPRDPGIYVSCLVLLEVPRVSGQAYPYTFWEDVPKAQEEGYLLIPPLREGLRSQTIRIDIGSGSSESQTLIDVTTSDGRIYRLDEHLLPISCRTGDFTEARGLRPTRPIAPLIYIADGTRRAVDIAVN